MADDTKFIFATADVCTLFDVSRETLREWHNKGAPKKGRGKWNIKELIQWKMGGKVEQSPEARKLKAEADLKEAKAAQEAIKLNIAKTEFVSVYEVNRELKRLFANLKKSLLSIAPNLSSELATLDRDVAEIIKTKIENTVTSALTELSEGREYKPKKKRKR